MRNARVAPAYEGSLSSRSLEAERARRDAADARAAEDWRSSHRRGQGRGGVGHGAARSAGSARRRRSGRPWYRPRCREGRRRGGRRAAGGGARPGRLSYLKPRRAPTLSKRASRTTPRRSDGASHWSLRRRRPAISMTPTLADDVSRRGARRRRVRVAPAQVGAERGRRRNALRAEVAARRSRPPPSPAPRRVEETLRERLRAADGAVDRRARLREAVAKPASPRSRVHLRGVDAARPAGGDRGGRERAARMALTR